jgi:two-component system cell cycle sensor histidine kinase/response regulator CckA
LEIVKKLTACAPIHMGAKLWSILVAMGYAEIAGPINRHARNTFGLAGLVILLFGAGGVLLFRTREKTAKLETESKYLKKIVRSAEALKASEEKLTGIVNSVTDHMSMMDEQYTIVWANDIARSLFGEDLIGKKCYTTYHGRDKVCQPCIVSKCFKDGKSHHHETEVVAEDGSQMTFWCTTSVAALHEDGQPKTVVEVSRDITERKSLKAQLFQAQKMEAIGTLAGGIAHDFNNILAVIQGNAQLMSMDLDTTKPHYELVKEIEGRVKVASNLTQQLLGFARGGKYEVKSFNLNDVVRESSIAFGRTKKEIAIQRKLREDLPPIEADIGQIEQVLMNLYVNAAHAMPDGGELHLETHTITDEDIQGKPFRIEPGSYVLLSVTDGGIGMDKETQKRIFDPFFTTREMGRGTGLGLASVYGIVKAHKGYIEVEPEKGCGTTFKIYLPVSKKETEKHVKLAEGIIKGTGTILLVDDEESVLKVGVRTLNMLGYTVLEARDGHEAVGIYKTDKHRIDLVILDMIMPDMGGGKVYDLLRAIKPEVKVLLCSGYSIDSQATEILELGCNGFIQKPFDMEVLSHKIRDLTKRDISLSDKEGEKIAVLQGAR